MNTSHIATLEISTKKDHAQTTRWLVTQSRPYPCITASGSALVWHNSGDLFPSYRNNHAPTRLPSEYTCHLLREDIDPAKLDNSRRDHAGFNPGFSYHDGQRIPQPDNPGAIVLRGHSLGEMSITFSGNPDWPDIKVRGYDTPTPAERAWIKDNIIPSLKSFIEANAASLRAAAVSALRDDMAARIATARAQLSQLEKQANDALTLL